MSCVVDTNVAVVAEGLTPQAGPRCVDVCQTRLETIVREGGLLLDSLDLIIEEYAGALGKAGRPGIGRAFVKWAFDYRFDPSKVRRVDILPVRPATWRRFAEVPDVPALRTFDGDDQKFVAVALSSGEHPSILNATDSDWANHHAALVAAGIRVEFLCPDECAP